jgi:hypothetical protein
VSAYRVELLVETAAESVAYVRERVERCMAAFPLTEVLTVELVDEE